MTSFIENNTLFLQGNLCYETLSIYLKDWQQLPKEVSYVNCKNLQRIDSAGLALLVTWQSQAQHHPYQYQNVPTQMQMLAKISGVEQVLGIEKTV